MKGKLNDTLSVSQLILTDLLPATFHSHLCGCLSLLKLCAVFFFLFFLNNHGIMSKQKKKHCLKGWHALICSKLTNTDLCLHREIDTHALQIILLVTEQVEKIQTFSGDAVICFNRTGCSILFMLSPFGAPPFWAKQQNLLASSVKAVKLKVVVWLFSQCSPPHPTTHVLFANTAALFGHRHTSCITGLADLPTGCEVWTLLSPGV